MKKPDMNKVKTIAWSAIGGAFILLIVGFSWGGWVLGSTSMEAGEKMAREAVIDRLAPICFGQYNQDPEKEAKLRSISDLYNWEKEKFIIDQGWATMPFEEEADSGVAAQCSKLIMQANQ